MVYFTESAELVAVCLSSNNSNTCNTLQFTAGLYHAFGKRVFPFLSNNPVFKYLACGQIL